MRRKKLWLALIIGGLLPWFASAQEVNLTVVEGIPGWEKSESTQHFGPESLYNHINGGAELFLEFGFIECFVQVFRKAGQEIGVEVYRMESSTAALGIYLMKCGQETPLTALAARNSSDRYQFTIFKHNCFILVNNFSGEESNQKAMISLAQALLNALPSASPEIIFSRMPEENLVPGSRRIFRGPFGLQPLYTFGAGDILTQRGKIYGISGEYKNQAGSTYTRIILFYPSSTAADRAYEHLMANLDSYISVLKKTSFEFSFKDYQNRFGRVSVRGEVLDIKVNLINLDNS